MKGTSGKQAGAGRLGSARDRVSQEAGRTAKDREEGRKGSG